LEHGGAAPAIIDRSADLDRLIEPLAKGGYYHAAGNRGRPADPSA
jgi:acyl-CoA reductase-like NAD-dependent aldehyde dehydrogenase